LDSSLLEIAHPIFHDFMATAAHDPFYLSIYDEWIERWVICLQQILEDGVSTGRIVCSDPSSMARAISAMIQGIATRAYLTPAKHPTQWAIDSYRTLILKLCCSNEYSQDSE
jgi:hypothetical protein